MHDDAGADEGHGDREQHAHGDAAAESPDRGAEEEAELLVGLAEELADDAGNRIAQHEDAAEEAGPAEAEGAGGDGHDDEQDQSLAEGLIELARMARLGARMRKDHRIGKVGGGPAPELAVDEIGDAPEEQADRRHHRRHVEHGERVEPAPAREEHDGEHRSEEAAVKRHAAAPDREDLQRLREIGAEIVEQHVADPSAQHDAQRHPDDQVVHVRRLGLAQGAPEIGFCGEALGIEPAAEQARHIGKRVPADREGADGDRPPGR